MRTTVLLLYINEGLFLSPFFVFTSFAKSKAFYLFIYITLLESITATVTAANSHHLILICNALLNSSLSLSF